VTPAPIRIRDAPGAAVSRWKAARVELGLGLIADERTKGLKLLTTTTSNAGGPVVSIPIIR
jgi:hypothetical protein